MVVKGSFQKSWVLDVEWVGSEGGVRTFTIKVTLKIVN